MIFFPIDLTALLFLFGAALCAFGIAWRLEDFSIADVFWGIYQIVIATALLCSRQVPANPSQWLLFAMVTLWALRLSGFIALRRSKKSGEDWRYAKMRRDWGRSAAWQALLKIFWGQALLAYVLSFPIIQSLSRFNLNFRWPQLAGLALFSLGWIWESLGDWQLFVFKSRAPKGAIMSRGLWRYSRHPNYTGEICVWWGIYLFSNAWGAIASPVLITLLLLRISGVPLAEQRYEGRADYQEYKRQTPAVIPRFLLPFWRGTESSG